MVMRAVRMMIAARHEKLGLSQFRVVMVGTGDEVGPSGSTMAPGSATATASAMTTTASDATITINQVFTVTTLVGERVLMYLTSAWIDPNL
jgi:hypothetical protein